MGRYYWLFISEGEDWVKVMNIDTKEVRRIDKYIGIAKEDILVAHTIRAKMCPNYRRHYIYEYGFEGNDLFKEEE